MQSIIAAEVGYADLALRLLHQALFVDLADLHGNASRRRARGLDRRGLERHWSSVSAAFRDFDGELSLDPRLPRSWTGLTFRLTWRGSRLRVELTPGGVLLTVEDGPRLSLSVRGRPVEVEPGEPVRLPMDTHGLDLVGVPESLALSGERREDGTVITASVPTP